jgi:hypothetical protein
MRSKLQVVLLVLFALMIPTMVLAQVSKLEAFTSRHGCVVIIEHMSPWTVEEEKYTVRIVNQPNRDLTWVVRFAARLAYEPTKLSEVVGGLVIDITEFSGDRLGGHKSILIDNGDARNLSKAAAYLNELAGQWSRESKQFMVMAAYTSPAGLSLTLSQSGARQSLSIEAQGMAFGLSTQDLAKLQKTVDETIAFLNAREDAIRASAGGQH